MADLPLIRGQGPWSKAYKKYVCQEEKTTQPKLYCIVLTQTKHAVLEKTAKLGDLGVGNMRFGMLLTRWIVVGMEQMMYTELFCILWELATKLLLKQSHDTNLRQVTCNCWIKCPISEGATAWCDLLWTAFDICCIVQLASANKSKIQIERLI